MFKKYKKEILISITAIVLVFFIAIPVITLARFGDDLASKETLLSSKDEGITLYDKWEEPFFTFYEARVPNPVPLSDVSPNLVRAVIASEDEDFYSHGGYSIKAILGAFIANLRRGDVEYGGSTITQQLVKNSLLSPQRDITRKYQELILARELEKRFTKDEILEMYLNSVYFGEGAFGVEDAAKTYFNKSAKELSLAEASLLAGLITAPSRLSPISGDREAAFQRQKAVLREMLEENYITQAELDSASGQVLDFNETPVQGFRYKAPHFAMMVRDELIRRYGEQRIAHSGMKIHTTLDLKWQEYAEQAVSNQVAAISGNNVSNGAAVAMDPRTGEIRALVGSRDWEAPEIGKFNVVTAYRQPGSAFKPIVYLKAMEEHIITPATTLVDRRRSFGSYRPKNYDNRYRGNVSARYALANSLNVPSVEVMEKLGVEEGLEIAERLGISNLKEPSNYGLSLVLGGAEVSLLEMTGAYGVLAANGKKAEPILISSIQDKKGKTIFRNRERTREVVDPRYAFLMSSILSDSRARQSVFGNSLTISRQAAVKTGTTEDYKDSWTIGYTPSLVVGVWVGNNDGRPMSGVAGSLGAAPIWRNLMERFLAGTPVEEFERPRGIVTRNVCRPGIFASASRRSSYMEYFADGTEEDAVRCNPRRISDELRRFFLDEPTTSPTPSVSPSQEPTPTAQPEPTEQNNDLRDELEEAINRNNEERGRGGGNGNGNNDEDND